MESLKYFSLQAHLSRTTLVLEIVGDQSDSPIITEFDCSHTHPMLTLAQGVRVTIEAKQDFKTLLDVEESMME